MATTTRVAMTGVAFVAGFLVMVPSAAAAESSDRALGRADLNLVPKSGAQDAEPLERVGQPPHARQARAARGCKLSCVKRQLANLRQAHNQLVSAFNSLRSDYYGCEMITPVTQYDGYDYGGGAFETTALDFTTPGDFVDEYMVVYVC